MRCLIVGGTGFLGGAIADATFAAGHQTTILSRGKTVRCKTEGMEVLHADRHEDLSAIEGREFDWIFDTCAFTPDCVYTLLNAADSNVKRYVLISSISAYGTFENRGLTEDHDVASATPEDLLVARQVPVSERASAFSYGSSYGPLKRACEIAALEQLDERVTALRVGLLVGAGDYTDRLTWWVRRIDEAHGERSRIPVPGPIDRVVQLIDVNDVAQFALRCAEQEFSGVWNVTGVPMPLIELLNEIIRITKSQAQFVSVEEQVVIDSGIRPWTDIPLMAPTPREFRYFMEVDTNRAQSAGLLCRPLEKTLVQLLDWDKGRRSVQLKGGMVPEQEALLLGM